VIASEVGVIASDARAVDRDVESMNGGVRAMPSCRRRKHGREFAAACHRVAPATGGSDGAREGSAAFNGS